MKPRLLLAALLLCAVAACDNPAAPELAALPSIPDDARVQTFVLDYEASLAKVGADAATVDFTVDIPLDDAYRVQVYFEEVGTWAQLPYTLAGDYCGDFIDLDFIYFGNTVRLRITPQTLRPSTRVLPPDTRLKVVATTP